MSISILLNDSFLEKISNSINSLKVDIQNLDDLFREHINNITLLSSVEKDIISTQINFFVILYDYISSSATNHSPYFSIIVNLKTLLNLLIFIFSDDKFDSNNTKNYESRTTLLNALHSIDSKFTEEQNTKDIYAYGRKLKQYSYAELNDILQSQAFNISDVMKLNVRNFTSTVNRYNIKNFNYIQTTKLRFLVDLFENSITNLNYSSNDSLYSSLAIVSGLFVTIQNILAPNYNLKNILTDRYSLQYELNLTNPDISLSLFQYILFSVYEMFDFMQFYVLASFHDNPNDDSDDFKIDIKLSDYSFNVYNFSNEDISYEQDDHLNLFKVISKIDLNQVYIKESFENIMKQNFDSNKENLIETLKVILLYQDPENQNAQELDGIKYSVQLLDTRNNLLKLRLSQDDTGVYLLKNAITVSKQYYNFVQPEGESGSYEEVPSGATSASFLIEQSIDDLRQFVDETLLENNKKIYESTFTYASDNKKYFMWKDLIVKIYRKNNTIENVVYENN